MQKYWRGCLTCNCTPCNHVGMKLAEYLSEKSISDAAFAEAIGAHPSTIWRLKNDKTRPDWNTVEAITRETQGEVTANDFVPASPSDRSAS